MSDNNSKGNEGEEEKELTVEEVEATKQLEKARKRAAFQKNQAKKLADHLYKDADVDVDVDVDVDEGGGDVSDTCSNSASAAVSCNSTSCSDSRTPAVFYGGGGRKYADSKSAYVDKHRGGRERMKDDEGVSKRRKSENNSDASKAGCYFIHI